MFADLVDGSVSRSLQALMNELAGPGAVRPGDVGLPTINGYAYYVYSRSGMVRVTLRTPLAFKALGNNPKYSGRVRWRTRSRPHYEQIVARWRDRDLTTLTSTELLAGVVGLLDAGTEYYTAVQTIIPVAAMSEMFFTRFYNTVVRRTGDPTAVTFLLGFDSLPIRAEQSLADLGGWLRERPALAEVLLGESSAILLCRLGAQSDGDWPEFRRRFAGHLRDFGHLVYNLDFVNPVPADDPTTVVDTLRFSVRGEAGDPYERQQRSVTAREAGTALVRTRLGLLRRRAFDRLLHWAQEVAPEREDALAEVGLAWPSLRRLLAEIGGRLVAVGVIDQPADVYWLRHAEIKGSPAGSLAVTVEQRSTGLARSAAGDSAPDAAGGRRAAGIQERAAGRLQSPAARGGAGRRRHHPGLDLVVRPGRRDGDRHRRTTEPQLDRGPGVPHSRRARHGRGDQAHPQRATDHGGRRHRTGPPRRQLSNQG